MPKSKPPTTPTRTLKRTVKMTVDLAGWVSWYSTVTGKEIATITDEMHREYIKAHHHEHPGGPTITSSPIAETFPNSARPQ